MRRSFRWVPLLILCALAGYGQSPPQQAAEVSALLPVAHIERGAAARADARLNDPVFWQDWFETEAQGRARLAFLDGSLLNVGSGARLQVVEHDQTSERTELELRFGKVRAQVKQRTRPGGRFTVRTDSAVVGVIGTHLYVSAAAALTTVINFEGQVRVSNADRSVAGEETLEPFELAEIEPGQPPHKRLATLEELLQALRDTLPGLPLAGAPMRARAGACVQATLGEAVTGPADPASSPLNIVTRGCKGPDVTPVQMCVPESAPPGVREYAMRAADGSLRWAALLVEPPAPYEGARILVAPELPPGATHYARVVGRDNQPLAGVPVRVRRGSEEQIIYTDENGAFVVQAPESGTFELAVSREAPGSGTEAGAARGPFGRPEPLVAIVKVVDRMEARSELPDYGQRGTLVGVPGQVESARIGETPLPVLRTITRAGKTVSSVVIPAELPEGPRELELEEPGGQRKTHSLFVYEVLWGHLDQAALSTGGVTNGEFLVCVGPPGEKSRKIRARIVATGPVSFRGPGGKGKDYERSFSLESSGLLRIPFQIQAEKGSPTGIPFFLNLSLQSD